MGSERLNIPPVLVYYFVSFPPHNSLIEVVLFLHHNARCMRVLPCGAFKDTLEHAMCQLGVVLLNPQSSPLHIRHMSPTAVAAFTQVLRLSAL